MKEHLQSLLWKLYCRTLPSKEELTYQNGIKSFKQKIMDPEFDWKPYVKAINPYFEKHGFRYSMLDSEYYYQCNGIKSDLYLPLSFYTMFLYPYLNPERWRIAYTDKNMFSRFLNIKEAQKHIDIQMPECIVYCDNGCFYKPDDEPCDREEAINLILDCKEDMIIKPTLNSTHGSGVALIESSQASREHVKDIISKYEKNFTVQKKIIQHPDLAAFNPTSVNSVRITTYMDFRGKVKVLYASQRFGGKGKVYDNADDPKGTGGFCAIMPDGTVKREIHHYRNIKTTLLDDSIPQKIPCFDKVVEAAKYLHTRFPQFGLIGWDMTVTPDGHPLVIEYNFQPGLGTSQLANGPMFEKEDLDEIMEHIKKQKFRTMARILISFHDKDMTHNVIRKVK